MKYKYRNFSYLIAFLLFFYLVLDLVYTKIFFKTIFTKNEIFHHHLSPNSTSEDGGNIYPNYKIITNSLGFRDSKNREIDLKNKDRIIFMGNSFVFGILLDYEFTVVGLADVYFNKNGIEVLNAGVSSYSPSIYYHKINYFIKKGLKFSHLVVFIDISDVEDKSIIYKYDKKTKSIKSSLDEIKIEKFRQFLKKNLIITSNILKYINDKIVYKNDPENFIKYYTSSAVVRDKWTIDENIRKKYDLGIQKNIYYMKLLKNLLDKNNINLTIVVYPWISQIYHNDLNSIQVKIWKEFSEKNKNQFINLFPIFFNEKDLNLDIYEKILLYFIPNDIHWNKNGSQKIWDSFINEFKY